MKKCKFRIADLQDFSTTPPKPIPKAPEVPLPKFTVNQKVTDTVQVDVDIDSVIRALNMMPFENRVPYFESLIKNSLLDFFDGQTTDASKIKLKQWLCNKVDELKF